MKFLYSSVPETFVQRVGALFLGLSGLLPFTIIIAVIHQAWDGAWTPFGFFASVFGLVFCGVTAAMGILHWLISVLPGRFRKTPIGQSTGHFSFAMRKAEEFKFIYRMAGWAVVLVLPFYILYWATR